MIREYVKARCEGEGTLKFQSGIASNKTNWGAITIAAWGVFNEGLEILVVWLAIALRNEPGIATIGAVIGIGLVMLLAIVFRRVFHLIPPKYLDLIAGIALVCYGIIFGIQAII